MADGGIGLDFVLLQGEASRKGLVLIHQDGYYKLECAGRCVGNYLSLNRVEQALEVYDEEDDD